MSNGFGTINARNINEIVASLAKQIKDIKTDFAKDYTVLNNKLEKCEEVLQDLKDYIDTVEDNIESEYQNLKTQINKFDEEIAEIRAELSQVNYRKIGDETVAVGIAPLSEYSATSSTYPFSAKYAVNDSDGNNIVDTYATKVELGSVSSTLCADYTQKIAESSSEGMSALSSVSGQLTNAIDNEALARQTKDEELDGAIRNESNERIAKDNELEERIATEESAREEAISGLQDLLQQEVIDLTNVIETETARATSAEIALRNSLTKEIVDRANAITDLGNDLGKQIADETNRATSAENDIIEYINDFADITEENIQTLENTISSVSSDLSLIINDNYDTLADNLEEEINRASSEENLLSAAINDEKNDREEAISALQETITNEIEAKINELSGTVETGFEQLNNVDTELSGHIDNVSAGVTALSNDLHTNYYNKEEVDEAIANFGGFEVHPSTADVVLPKTNIIYLIGPSASTASDLYQEYIYTSGNGFILIGDTTVDLSNYYQKDDVDGFVSDLSADISAETTRATDAENTISQNLVTSATNLENTKQDNVSISYSNEILTIHF